jgi:uncharacterized membrane protein
MAEDSLEELKIWSIKLGFNGEISNDFYRKLDSVKRVRKRIRGEILMAIVIFIMSTSVYLALSHNIYTNEYREQVMIFMIFAVLLSCFSALAHTRVVVQWQAHDKEMIEEWEKKNNSAKKNENTIETQTKE